MISVPTTLVLGAGASIPYGFPSGGALRNQLCNPEFMGELTKHTEFTVREIEQFCQVFSRSGMGSIDAFLARRGEHRVLVGGSTFSEIGKAAIAMTLIRCESEGLLFNASIEDHWYEYLWHLLEDCLETIGEGLLNIITFNYDRSLECYLLSVIRNAYGINDEAAAKLLKKIPITHVYGKLGELPYLASGSVEQREYVPALSWRNIKIAAAGIKVIGEHREDGPEFEQAHNFLYKAERICFLGFGFDRTNVRRLNIESILRDRYRDSGFRGPRTFATTIGMTPFERDRLLEMLVPREVDVSPSNMQQKMNCEMLAKSIVDEIRGRGNHPSRSYLRHTGAMHGK